VRTLEAAAPIISGALVTSAVVGVGAYAIDDEAASKRKRFGFEVGAVTLAAITAWEAFWFGRRFLRRQQVFQVAEAWAKSLNRPLIVIGAPDGGVTSGYGCGDTTIDLAPTSCPNGKVLDITKPLPFTDDSVVVFCSCVLEYVDDPNAAISEIRRISGGYMFFVGVEPWTLTSLLYPGARQSLSPPFR
jgi:SAM-dependent methyltransferase